MTAAYDQETEKGWVEATPLDAIQDPPLRCRVKVTGHFDQWEESYLTGYDRTDKYKWGVADPQIQWAVHCEVWKALPRFLNPPAPSTKECVATRA